MNHFKLLIFSGLCCFSTLIFGQEPTENLMASLPKGSDIFGMSYSPIVGLIPAKMDKTFSPAQVEALTLALQNKLKGNAQTTYSLISKKDLNRALNLMKGYGVQLDKVRRKHYQSTVAVQYLLGMDFHYFDLKVKVDTIRNPDPKRSHQYEIQRSVLMTANYTLRLTDVASSKLVAVENYQVYGNSNPTRDSRPRSGYEAADSSFAFKRLWENAATASETFLKDNLHAAGRVKSMLETSKERAKVVALDNCPQAWLPKSTYLPVWKVVKKYPINSHDTIRWLSKMAMVGKMKDFTPTKINFDVTDGEKAVFEAMNAGNPLVVLTKNYPPLVVSPEFGRPALALDSVTNVSKISVGQAQMLRGALGAYFADRPALADLIDRDAYQFIEKERAMQQVVQSGDIEQGITIGADYLITAEVLGLERRREILSIPDPAIVAAKKAEAEKKEAEKKKQEAQNKDKKAETAEKKKEEPKQPAWTKLVPKDDGIPKIPNEIQTVANLSVNVKLVDVQSGEILKSQKIQSQLEHRIKYTRDPALVEQGDEALFRSLSKDFAEKAGGFFRSAFVKQLRLLEISKIDDDEAERVIVQGGSLYGFFGGDRLEVVELTEETVDGQKLERTTIVAELKPDDIYPEVMDCKVKDGEKVLLQKFNSKAKLMVRLKN